LNHNSIQDKLYLESLTFDIKKLIRISHEHAKVCGSFHKALKEEYNEAGKQPAPNADAAQKQHNPTWQSGSDIQ
jgi:hypothetical protein